MKLMTKEKCDALALAAVERHGLYVIQDGDMFAISIDGSGDDPSDEQRVECFWYVCPGDAAYAYCKRNDIRMGVPSETSKWRPPR